MAGTPGDQCFPQLQLAHREMMPPSDWRLEDYHHFPITFALPSTGFIEREIVCGRCGAVIVCTIYSARQARLRRLVRSVRRFVTQLGMIAVTIGLGVLGLVAWQHLPDSVLGWVLRVGLAIGLVCDFLVFVALSAVSFTPEIGPFRTDPGLLIDDGTKGRSAIHGLRHPQDASYVPRTPPDQDIEAVGE